MSRTLVYAHRGANREAAENTRSAFERALQYPVDGIETDIQLSRDGVAVLWHDRFLGKLGKPLRRIDDYDYAQLQTMDFAAHFSQDAKPEGILSLQAFLESYRGRCRLLLEIKNRNWESSSRQEEKVRQTLAMIGDGAGGQQDGNILVSSFNLGSLVYAHQYGSRFSLVHNFEPEQTLADARQILDAHAFLHGLCLPIASLDEAMTGLLRDRGKSIAIYTCNSDEEIRKALDLEVDILISDVPQKALQMRGR